KVAQGKYILLLDADTQIISDNFDHLLHYMEKNKTIGILGCSMLTGDNKPYSSARTLPTPRQIILRRLAYYGYCKKSQLLKNHHVLPQGITHPIQVGYVIGAFQLIRKQYMQTIGLLDEKMFFGYEDADFCARMKKAGFSVIFFPNFTIRHYVQGLTRKQPFSKLMFKHIKSYIIFFIKHHDILRQRYST
ncbi:MAG: glycosyltransferase, partial [Candidatus Hodarchaeota archaeon]